MSVRSKLKYYYLRYVHLKGDPKALALGSAIGAFMGVMPIMPVRTIAIVATTVPLKANTLAALIIAALVANPFTLAFLYYFAVITGNAVTTYTLNWERVTSVLDILTSGSGMDAAFRAIGSLGLEALIVLIVGGVTLAVPVGFLTYALCLRFFSTRMVSEKNAS
jgi:uncharacterized protein (DUF2062 family)